MRKIVVFILFLLFCQLPTAKSQQPASPSYLIVTPNNEGIRQWADTLARFRNEQGILTKVVSLNDIGENLEYTLKKYFKEFYKSQQDNKTTSQQAAILLFGDYSEDSSEGIISFNVNSIHDNKVRYLTDNKFVDFNNDGLPEMVIARMPAANAMQAELMVKKTINYERHPSENPDYYLRPVTAMGFQESRWFQLCSEVVAGYFEKIGKEPQRYNSIYEGQPDSVWSTAENTNKIIKYFGPEGLGYIPSNIQHLTEWDANQNDLCRAINEGTFLVQHRDHGDYQKWNNPYLSNSDINTLSNKDLTFVMSANCRTGHFGYGEHDNDCLAERFLRIEDGAVAVVAASEISYSFVNDVYVWGFYDYLWGDFMPNDDDDDDDDDNDDDDDDDNDDAFKYPAFANAYGKHFLMKSSWPYLPIHKSVTYDIMHYFGDAFLQLNTEMPQEIDITYPKEILSNCTSFSVHKDKNTRVAFSVDGELIATLFGEDSIVNINKFYKEGKIKVVATKQNHYRHEGYIYVKSYLNQEDLKIYPNPVRDVLFVESKDVKRLVIYDNLGHKLKEVNNNNSDELIQLDCSSFSKGTYHLQIIYDDRNAIKTFVKK